MNKSSHMFNFEGFCCVVGGAAPGILTWDSCVGSLTSVTEHRCERKWPNRNQSKRYSNATVSIQNCTQFNIIVWRNSLRVGGVVIVEIRAVANSTLFKRQITRTIDRQTSLHIEGAIFQKFHAHRRKQSLTYSLRRIFPGFQGVRIRSVRDFVKRLRVKGGAPTEFL